MCVIFGHVVWAVAAVSAVAAIDGVDAVASEQWQAPQFLFRATLP